MNCTSFRPERNRRCSQILWKFWCDFGEKNSGNHECKNLSIDSSDPPCPIQKGQYTNLKFIDDAIHITNIDKNYINTKVGFDLKIQTVDDPNTINGLFLTNVLTCYQTTYSDVVPDQFSNDTNLLTAKTLHFLFIGLKSGIHAIDAYWVFSLWKKTDCEQTEVLYENAITYFLKPQQEIKTRPHTYSPFENVQEMNDCVCGSFVDLTPFIIWFKHLLEEHQPCIMDLKEKFE